MGSYRDMTQFGKFGYSDTLWILTVSDARFLENSRTPLTGVTNAKSTAPS